MEAETNIANKVDQTHFACSLSYKDATFGSLDMYDWSTHGNEENSGEGSRKGNLLRQGNRMQILWR